MATLVLDGLIPDFQLSGGSYVREPIPEKSHRVYGNDMIKHYPAGVVWKFREKGTGSCAILVIRPRFKITKFVLCVASKPGVDVIEAQLK
ncbi:hypothetical protein AVEN_79700-1 [Araneus ventricosus]|uniref:Uncharacterized protein n=1 Tax=Araneus ventricosus TaxID=182803 RepID=A0A4Y2VAE4_ARAVE|nr:hypothetical protein AVEN_79700-1 [Araneus ventricosus]